MAKSAYTFLAPEVLQISSMDCGVAALACFARAYNCSLSYERLRDACQTGVDGTSIDSLEDVAVSLGIDVIQHVVPKDMFLDSMEGRYPFIAIVRHDAGVPHFVVVWRRLGPLLQIMNPAGGREWMLASKFLASLYIHVHRMPAEDFLEWWSMSSFAETLEEIGRKELTGQPRELITSLREGREVAEIGSADAALRLVRFANQRGLTRGGGGDLFLRSYENFVKAFGAKNAVSFHRLRSLDLDSLNEGFVALTGGIALAAPERHQARTLVRFQEEQPSPGAGAEGEDSPSDAADGDGEGEGEGKDEAPSLHAADNRPAVASEFLESKKAEQGLFSTVWELLNPANRLLAVALAIANVIFVPIVICETFFYRAAVDASKLFDSPSVRVQVSAIVLSFFVLIAGLERLTDWGSRRVGAFLEVRLRLAVLRAMPRVDEVFVRSRPTTDLAYRAHALTQGRTLPFLGFALFRGTAELLAALVALAFLEPYAIPIIAVGALTLVIASSISLSAMREVGVRFQAHAARILLLFLDALRGIRPVRTHGYQSAIRRDYERELVGWRKTGETDLQVRGLFGVLEAFVGLAITSACLYVHVARHPDVRGFVMLAFWAMRVPANVSGLIGLLRSLPVAQLSLSRILEVTRYATESDEGRKQIPIRRNGVQLSFRNVRVLVAGRTLLDTFSLDIPAGQHVAIVGPSGAGKSSLLGLLLGLLRRSTGTVTANDVPLDESTYPSLRSMSAWVDPSTQLWNRNLLENLEYATTGETRRSLEEVLVAANLFPVVDNLSEGLGTKIGWDGSFLSGGEGQRVRIARALLQSETKLAAMDEPFRGLDQTTRRKMLNETRRLWLNATMLFVSHDISHALDFDRVLVVEDGRIVEDGHPLALRQDPESRFRTLLDAEDSARKDVWNSQEWRRLKLVNGVLEERGA